MWAKASAKSRRRIKLNNLISKTSISCCILYFRKVKTFVALERQSIEINTIYLCGFQQFSGILYLRRNINDISTFDHDWMYVDAVLDAVHLIQMHKMDIWQQRDYIVRIYYISKSVKCRHHNHNRWEWKLFVNSSYAQQINGLNLCVVCMQQSVNRLVDAVDGNVFG